MPHTDAHAHAPRPAPVACPQLPRKGTLEFDYVSTARPSKRSLPLNDATFHHMVVSTRLEELLEMMSMEIGRCVWGQCGWCG